jgi:hypothetical protein
MFLIISLAMTIAGVLGLLLARSTAGCVAGGIVVIAGVASMIFVR